MLKIHRCESVNGFGNLKERRLNFFSISVRFAAVIQNSSHRRWKEKVSVSDGKLGLVFSEWAVRTQNIVIGDI
jgi:hypothetical protein